MINRQCNKVTAHDPHRWSSNSGLDYFQCEGRSGNDWNKPIPIGACTGPHGDNGGDVSWCRESCTLCMGSRARPCHFPTQTKPKRKWKLSVKYRIAIFGMSMAFLGYAFGYVATNSVANQCVASFMTNDRICSFNIVTTPFLFIGG